MDSIVGKIATKKASLSLNEKASQEPHPIHPLEQPHLGPLQRIPNMKIPTLPDALCVHPRVCACKRVMFLEPEADDRRNLDFRHLLVKPLVEHNEFFCLDIPPVSDVLSCLCDQLLKSLLDLRFRSTPEPHFLEPEEEIHDPPQPRVDGLQPPPPIRNKCLARQS
ncbi:MAG: hypothetical protein HW407_1769 [Bacteroidetes bacterium]|nr:hypothetical protein [Bacteroidota bacterium]